jgi:deazaflavin-dependent oxidoreductase (nitroreductase family)
MAADELKSALRDASEVDLTVTGRKSGQQSTRPVWFVLEPDKVLLVPVTGTDSSWYRNIEKTPAVGLRAEGAEFSANANPTDDPAVVEHAAEVFGEKYGADKVRDYYPKLNAAVEVPLT